MARLPPGVEKKTSKTGKTSYEVRLSFGTGGDRIQLQRRFPTARAAAQWRAEQVDAHAKGVAVAPTSLTVAAAVTDWLSSRRVKPTTLAAYTAALAPVVDTYGDRRVQKITKADAEALIVALQEGTTRRGVWARTSINPMLARWKGVWRDLLAQGIIPRDVVALVEPLRKKDAKPVLRLDDVLSRKETEAVLAAHGDGGPRAPGDAKGGERSAYARARRRELFLHLALLGLRRGELAGLRWSAVSDLDGDVPTLTIAPTRVVVRGKVIDQDDAKTASSGRTLPIPPHVVPILQRVQREQVGQKKLRGKHWRGPTDPWIIAHPDGRPVQPGTMNSWWNTALTYANVGPRRLHASRHTAATTLILGGAPAAVVAAWLGHGDGGVLALRTYGHVTSDDLRGVVGVFGHPEGTDISDV